MKIAKVNLHITGSIEFEESTPSEQPTLFTADKQIVEEPMSQKQYFKLKSLGVDADASMSKRKAWEMIQKLEYEKVRQEATSPSTWTNNTPLPWEQPVKKGRGRPKGSRNKTL